MQRLPKQQRWRWSQRLQIIVGARQRLEPYWADFEFIVRQLQTLLGKEAVETLRFDEDTLGSEACFACPGQRLTTSNGGFGKPRLRTCPY